MIRKIQKVENYAVVVSDDEIKEGEIIPYVMCWENNTYTFENSNNGIRKSKLKYAKKVIATIAPYKIEGLPMLELELPNQEITIGSVTNFGIITDINENSICVGKNKKGVELWYKKSSVYLLPNQEEDEEKLADNYALSKYPKELNEEKTTGKDIGYSLVQIERSVCKDDFIAGYKAAQSKKWSDEDLHKAFEAGMKFIGEDKGSYKEFLQSLQKKQFPIAVELEIECGIVEQCECISNSECLKTTFKVIKWYYE